MADTATATSTVQDAVQPPAMPVHNDQSNSIPVTETSVPTDVKPNISELPLTTAQLLQKSLTPYAAQLLQSIKPGDVYFAATPQSLVSHMQYTLSGIDCIQLTKCIDELRVNKLNDTPEYKSLASLLHSCTQQQQHALQQARLKLLSAVYSNNSIVDNIQRHDPHMSQQLAQSELTAASVPWSIRTVLDRDLAGTINLLTHRQLQQLSIQIKASSYLLQLRPLPDVVLDGIRTCDEISDLQHHIQQSHTDSNKSKEAQLNNKLNALHVKQDALIAQITGGRSMEPISALYDAWCAKTQPAQVPYSMVRYERDTYASNTSRQRRLQLNKYIHEHYTQYGDLVPDTLRKQQLQYQLIHLQKRVRHSVIASLPFESCATGRYRNARQIDNDVKQRLKKQKSQRQLLDKTERANRSNYTKAILTHCRNLYDFHLKRRMQAKKVCDAVIKQIELNVRKTEDYRARQERQRLQALRENNEEEYVKLLKEAKNNRLLHLLEQTDAYMTKLSSHITAEQNKAAEHALTEQLNDAIQVDQLDGKSKQSYMRLSAPALVVSNYDNNHNQQTAQNDGLAVKSVVDNSNDNGHVEGDENSLEYLMNARKRYYQNAHKVKESITAQPRCMKFGQLRQYQLDGLRWLISLSNNNLNGILADEMGLGKTVQSISLLAYLMETKQQYGPFLVIAPMSTLHNNWAYEFTRWLPDAKVVIYDGNKSERKMLREKYILTGEFNVLLTTFEYSMRDTILRKIQWKYIIIDEAHRLKNSKCKLANELNKYSINSKRLALTGTPLQNDLPELWNLLNFLHPGIFNSTGSFDQFLLTDNVLNEEEQLLIVNRLHSILRPFMLRREKKQVETDMPDKIEKIIHCKLTHTQQLLYDTICENNLSVHNKIMQLRKVCNHLLLFHPYVRSINHSTSYNDSINYIKLSGKFQILDQILPKLFITKHRILIFNQMTKCMDVLDRYLEYRGYKFLRLDGMTDAAVRKRNLELFNAKDSDYFIFILSTKAGGLGLNLQTSDTVILFDSDWNPQQDLQAMARAHRIGQKNQVLILRLVCESTIEEKVLKTAAGKLQNEMMVVRAGMFHSEFSEGKSREMVQQVMVEKAGQTATATNSDQREREEGVSKIIARSDLELELFLELDARNNPYDNDNTTVPMWLVDYCVRGNKATSCDESLTRYNVDLIKQARQNIENNSHFLEKQRNAVGSRLRSPLYYLDDRQYTLTKQQAVEADPFLPLTEQYTLRQKWSETMSLPEAELKKLTQAAQAKFEEADANKEQFETQKHSNKHNGDQPAEETANSTPSDNEGTDSDSDGDGSGVNENESLARQMNGSKKRPPDSNKHSNKVKLKRVKV